MMLDFGCGLWMDAVPETRVLFGGWEEEGIPQGLNPRLQDLN